MSILAPCNTSSLTVDNNFVLLLNVKNKTHLVKRLQLPLSSVAAKIKFNFMKKRHNWYCSRIYFRNIGLVTGLFVSFLFISCKTDLLYFPANFAASYSKLNDLALPTTSKFVQFCIFTKPKSRSTRRTYSDLKFEHAYRRQRNVTHTPSITIPLGKFFISRLNPQQFSFSSLINF